MKLTKISALCLAASSLFAASSAMAWENADKSINVTANVAATTNYMWRGVSQSDNAPAIQGGFDVSHSSGLYAGFWASNVNFSGATLENDWYGGFANDIGDTGLSYDLSYLYYSYPTTAGNDWGEVSGKLSYSFLTAGVAYSNRAFGAKDQEEYYYSLDGSYDLPSGFTLAGGVGYSDLDAYDNYTDYHLGVSTEVAGLGLDLSYIGSDIDNSATSLSQEQYTNQVVFTVSKSM